MLIDLEWTLNDSMSFIKKFDTEGGHLVITYEFPQNSACPGTHRRMIARRINKGVYVSRDMWNDIGSYTNWDVEHPFKRPRMLWNMMSESKDPDEKNALRTELLRIKNEYGNADDLKQVFKYGNKFIKGRDPYVLGVCLRDVDADVDRYLDKNGGYIGNRKISELKEMLFFHFYKLNPKE